MVLSPATSPLLARSSPLGAGHSHACVHSRAHLRAPTSPITSAAAASCNRCIPTSGFAHGQHAAPMQQRLPRWQGLVLPQAVVHPSLAMSNGHGHGDDGQQHGETQVQTHDPRLTDDVSTMMLETSWQHAAALDSSRVIPMMPSSPSRSPSPPRSPPRHTYFTPPPVFDPWGAAPGAVPSPAPPRTCLLGIRVKDFALVKEQVVAFGPGLNAITGESGSGKSVLVEALGQVLGAPAPQECVRAPAEMAVVEGAFWVTPSMSGAVRAALAEHGVPRKALPAAGQGARLDIRREILVSSEGGGAARLRSRCFVNGAPVTLRALRSLGAGLVDMNGQHSSVALADSSVQLALLDRVAGTSALVAQVAATLGELREVEARLESLDALSDAREREGLRKMVDAVSKMRLKAGEEVGLRKAVRAAESRRQAAEQCAAIREAINGEAGASGPAAGVLGGIRWVESQVRGLMSREETLAAATAGPSAPAASTKRRPASAAPGSSSAVAAPTVAAGRSAPAAPGGTDAEGGAKQEQAGASGKEGSMDEEDLFQGHDQDSDGESPRASQGGRGPMAQVGEEDAEEEEDEDEEEDGPTAQLERALDALAAARQQLASAEAAVKTYARTTGFDAVEADRQAERLQKIERLLRSHRVRTVGELVDKAAAAEAALAEWEEQAEHVEEWEEELDLLRASLLADCVALAKARRAAAPALRAHVERALGQLAMGGAQFEVSLSWHLEPKASSLKDSEALDISADTVAEVLGGSTAAAAADGGVATYRVYSTGLDRIELKLSAGPAEPLRPLSAVASGGECARIMLALKAAPATAAASAASNQPAAAVNSGHAASNGSEAGAAAGGDAVVSQLHPGTAPIMILDELDSGVGSRLGNSVGAMLRGMAGGADGAAPRGSQVICVTHLPQVAAHAATHVRVAKGTEIEGRVTTRFQHLPSFGERAEEVAAMMGMDVAHAEDMLHQASQI